MGAIMVTVASLTALVILDGAVIAGLTLSALPLAAPLIRRCGP